MVKHQTALTGFPMSTTPAWHAATSAL